MLHLSEEQLTQLSANQVEVETLERFWRLWPELMFDAAIGGVIDLKNGRGQERDSRFNPDMSGVVPSSDFLSATMEEPTVEPMVGEEK